MGVFCLLLLDPIGSQYIRAIFGALNVSAHMLKTNYNQILLTPLILSAPLHNQEQSY